jgi:TolB-like protein/AraC-like DNA-binding protein
MSGNFLSEDQFLKRLTEITEANLANEQFGVSELAREMGMSRSNLHRKLFASTKLSVSQFICQHRLKKAMEILRHTALTVSEVAFQVGFGSVTYFTKCFHDYYGYPPGEVGKRNHETNSTNNSAANNKQLPPNKVPINRHLAFASGLFIIALVALVIYNYIPFRQEKSIAVLPFKAIGSDAETKDIVDGLHEDILDKLEKISELQVKSRTDVEQYRNSQFGTREIARNLNVNYILEGSGQKIGNTIVFRLQLIEAKNGLHLWSNPFTVMIDSTKIFSIQKEVALLVANELKAVITPEEEIELEKQLTKSVAARNNYEFALSQLETAEFDWRIREVLVAKRHLEKAIKLDSTFSMAYTKLAHVYFNNLYWRKYPDSTKQRFNETGYRMINKALQYDSTNYEAYIIRAIYYGRIGNTILRRKDSIMCRKYLPKNYNNNKIYYGRFLGYLYDEPAKALEIFYEKIENQPDAPKKNIGFYMSLSRCFYYYGFSESGRKYLNQYLEDFGDTSNYFKWMSGLECNSLNFSKSNEFVDLSYKNSKNDIYDLRTFIHFKIYANDYEGAYKLLSRMEQLNDTAKMKLDPDIDLGYLYQRKGETAKANLQIDGEMKQAEQAIKMTQNSQTIFYNNMMIALGYAQKRDKTKALKYIQLLKECDRPPRNNLIILIYSPIFQSIRNEPQFIDVVQTLKQRHRAIQDEMQAVMRKHGIKEKPVYFP